MVSVDVLTPVAPDDRPMEDVIAALGRQGYVETRHHVVESPLPLPGEHRAATIARARNRAKRYGSCRYAMFLDSDVELPDDGIEKLIFGLALRPEYAALGINYQDPVRPPAVHVAMGAVLFVRQALDRVRFRTEPGKCECLCCCEDIRRMGYRIDYLPGLRANHLR